MIAVALAAIMMRAVRRLRCIGILIPTLIHVSLFTLVFMVLGAFRSGSRVQAVLIAGLSRGDRLILLHAADRRRSGSPASPRSAKEYFGNVGPALGRLFGVPGLTLDTRLTSLLAFVYTYHYLNWFIKAEVIRWTDMPKARLAAIAAASAASTALYFYDYAFGFTFLLALSLVHILLEFPLNSLALRQLGAAMQGAVRARYAGLIAAPDAVASTGTKAAKREPGHAEHLSRSCVDTRPAGRWSSR